MNSSIVKTIYFSFAIAIVHFVVMMILQEVLLTVVVDNDIRYWGRVSSIFSNLVASGIIFLVIILLAIVPFWILNYLGEQQLLFKTYYPVIKVFFISYLCYEFIKLLFIYVYVHSETSVNVGNMDYIQNFNKYLSGTILLWYDFIYIMFASIIFGMVYLFKIDGKLSDSLILSTMVFILFAILNMPTLKSIGLL